MGENVVRNARKRYRQGRLSLSKLNSIIKENQLATVNTAPWAPVSDNQDSELVVEEHVHSDECNH